MKKFKGLIKYLTVTEWLIWSLSVTAIITVFIIFGGGLLSFIASLIGVTSLILCAKGNPIGQVLMIVFSSLYGIISLSCSYYGELATYVFMTMPMSVYALVCWLKNPYENNKSEVRVISIGKTSGKSKPFLSQTLKNRTNPKKVVKTRKGAPLLEKSGFSRFGFRTKSEKRKKYH